MSEMNSLMNTPSEPIKLSGGVFVCIRRLKTIELFRMLRIITRGGVNYIDNLVMDPNLTEQEYMARLLLILMISIPEAEQETIDFIKTMIEPYGLVSLPQTKGDKERNEELWRKALAELQNPELEDSLTIIEAIIKAEAAHIQSLGKQLMVMIKAAFPNLAKDQKIPDVAPIDPESIHLTPETANVMTQPVSSVDSPKPSTWSPMNMDGPTTESLISP